MQDASQQLMACLPHVCVPEAPRTGVARNHDPPATGSTAEGCVCVMWQPHISQ